MHFVAVAVDDEGLLTRDGMSWHGPISEPHAAGLLDDGYHFDRFNNCGAEKAGRDI
ncbi:hypothetical protein J2X42_001696 [Arthrobacter sp. BE255]|nr:hypothetical protein [Arthrobacter sp. BE255]